MHLLHKLQCLVCELDKITSHHWHFNELSLTGWHPRSSQLHKEVISIEQTRIIKIAAMITCRGILKLNGNEGI
jgi:hypothetical protein